MTGRGETPFFLLGAGFSKACWQLPVMGELPALLSRHLQQSARPQVAASLNTLIHRLEQTQRRGIDFESLLEVVLSTRRDQFAQTGSNISRPLFRGIARRDVDVLEFESLKFIKSAVAITASAGGHAGAVFRLLSVWPVLNIFTTNYDVGVEQTADRLGIRWTDGFSEDQQGHTRWRGTFRAPHSGVPHLNLYKLHGSVSWYQLDAFRYERFFDEVTAARLLGKFRSLTHESLMIYPAFSKLVSQGLYLDLLHRFKRVAMRAPLGVILGFSCRDDHILNVLRMYLSASARHRVVIVDNDPDTARKNILSDGATRIGDDQILTVPGDLAATLPKLPKILGDLSSRDSQKTRIYVGYNWPINSTEFAACLPELIATRSLPHAVYQALRHFRRDYNSCLPQALAKCLNMDTLTVRDRDLRSALALVRADIEADRKRRKLIRLEDCKLLRAADTFLGRNGGDVLEFFRQPTNIDSALKEGWGLCRGANGEVLVTGYSSGTLSALNPSTLEERLLISQLRRPRGIALPDPRGTIAIVVENEAAGTEGRGQLAYCDLRTGTVRRLLGVPAAGDLALLRTRDEARELFASLPSWPSTIDPITHDRFIMTEATRLVEVSIDGALRVRVSTLTDRMFFNLFSIKRYGTSRQRVLAEAGVWDNFSSGAVFLLTPNPRQTVWRVEKMFEGIPKLSAVLPWSRTRLFVTSAREYPLGTVFKTTQRGRVTESWSELDRPWDLIRVDSQRLLISTSRGLYFLEI